MGADTEERWYLLIAFSRDEPAAERLAALDQWLARRGQRALRRVDFGFDALPSAEAGALVFGTALRDLRIRLLLDFLGQIDWTAPGQLQVMVREPDDARWAVVSLIPRGVDAQAVAPG